VARVAVLAGGPSSEHEVSLLSSRCLAGWLREAGHQVRLVLIGRDERWHLGAPGADLDAAGEAAGQQAAAALEQLAAARETAFLGLHGPYGEDGTVQRLLQDAGVPFTGSGPQASAICMDKELSKLAAQRLGGRCAGHQLVGGLNPPLIRIARTVGYPCFVKPLSCGSSVGAGRVDDEAGLTPAVAAAQAADPHAKALVEEFIPGLEATCAVLRLEGQARAMPLVSIHPGEDFYDYRAKYESEQTVLTCPAALAPEVTESIQRLALAMYESLELRGAARLDVILREHDGQPVFLELNTLPGFTDHSLVPLACRAAGLPPVQVVQAILDDANPPL